MRKCFAFQSLHRFCPSVRWGEAKSSCFNSRARSRTWAAARSHSFPSPWQPCQPRRYNPASWIPGQKSSHPFCWLTLRLKLRFSCWCGNASPTSCPFAARASQSCTPQRRPPPRAPLAVQTGAFVLQSCHSRANQRLGASSAWQLRAGNELLRHKELSL